MSCTEQEAFIRILCVRLVDRRYEPDVYHDIRSHESMLKAFFRDRTGLNLIVHPEFIKLEKPSPSPEPWMGIQEFLDVRDYILLSCVLAFLEYKGTREQFLLGDLISYLPSVYPADDLRDSTDSRSPLNWDLIEHRRSLVRVLRHLLQEHVLVELDGRTQDFSQGSSGEVLYESSRHASYYLMSYPKDITHIESLEEAVQQMLSAYANDENDIKRHRVFRHLLLSPGYSYLQGPEEDGIYLRNIANRLESEFSKKTPFAFELTQDFACLTLDYKPVGKALFPDQRALTDMLLELASAVRQAHAANAMTAYQGVLSFAYSAWQRLIHQLYDNQREKMSQSMADMSLGAFSNALQNELLWLGAVVLDAPTQMVHVQPLLSRCAASSVSIKDTQSKRTRHERKQKKTRSKNLAHEPTGLF